jgi:hypothetical protein
VHVWAEERRDRERIKREVRRDLLPIFSRARLGSVQFGQIRFSSSPKKRISEHLGKKTQFLEVGIVEFG